MLTSTERQLWSRRPQQPLSMFQRWEHLLFLHWEVDPEKLQERLPSGLQVDLFQGRAYLGVVPFLMRGIRPWWGPAVPWLSNFLELNLRTYVIDPQGRPGVFFFALHANRWLACAWARTWFSLPYTWSRLRYACSDGQRHAFQIGSRRGQPEFHGHFQYQPAGSAVVAEPDSLEEFLVDRYLLFTPCGGRLSSGQVHHPPYQIQGVTAELQLKGFWQAHGFPELSPEPVHSCYCRGVQVEVFPLLPLPAPESSRLASSSPRGPAPPRVTCPEISDR